MLAREEASYPVDAPAQQPYDNLEWLLSVNIDPASQLLPRELKGDLPTIAEKLGSTDKQVVILWRHYNVQLTNDKLIAKLTRKQLQQSKVTHHRLGTTFP